MTKKFEGDPLGNTCYIPAESFSREFIPKAVLSAFLALKGMRIVFGHKWYVKTMAMKNAEIGDFYFHNHGLTDEMIQDFSLLFEKGVNFIGYQDEAVFDKMNYAELVKKREQIEGFSRYKLWLCWGENDYNTLQGLLGSKQNLRYFGTPRSALWGDFGKKLFKSEIENEIISKYGSYVLIATSFQQAYLSKYYKAFDTLNSRFKSYQSNSRNMILKQMSTNLDYNNLEKLKMVIKEILDKTNYNIVIRPSSFELKNLKHFLIKNKINQNRIFIDSRISITPLIIASKCLIHFGSTVGIEGLRLGIKTISIHNCYPKIDSELKLSSYLSISPRLFTDLIKLISDESPNLDLSDINYYVASNEADSFYQKLFFEIQRINPLAFSEESGDNKFIVLKRPILYKLKISLRRSKLYRYDLLKRPKLADKIVKNILHNCSSIFDSNKTSLRLKKIERNTYIIEKIII